MAKKPAAPRASTDPSAPPAQWAAVGDLLVFQDGTVTVFLGLEPPPNMPSWAGLSDATVTFDHDAKTIVITGAKMPLEGAKLTGRVTRADGLADYTASVG